MRLSAGFAAALFLVLMTFAPTAKADALIGLTPAAGVALGPGGGSFSLLVSDNGSGSSQDALNNDPTGFQINLLFEDFVEFAGGSLSNLSFAAAPGFTLQAFASDPVGPTLSEDEVLNLSVTSGTPVALSATPTELGVFSFEGPGGTFTPDQGFTVTVVSNDDGDGNANDAFPTQTNSLIGLPIATVVGASESYGASAVAIPEPAIPGAVALAGGYLTFRRRRRAG